MPLSRREQLRYLIIMGVDKWHLTGGILTLRMRGFNAEAFFGTIGLIHTSPPASNARRSSRRCAPLERWAPIGVHRTGWAPIFIPIQESIVHGRSSGTYLSVELAIRA